MTLNEQLQAIREKSRERIPAASRSIMERAVDDLRRSGAVDRVVKVGERAPDFKLPNAAGRSGAWVMTLASSGSYSAVSGRPGRTASSTRTPGPEGSRQVVTVPATG